MLWDGEVIETHYFESRKILEKQKIFTSESKDTKVLFTNFLDKVYNAYLEEWQETHQLVLHSAYNKS